MVTDSPTVTMESLLETTITLLNGAIADPLRPPLPPKLGIPYARKISPQWVIRYTSCLVLEWGLRGRQI